MSIASPSILQVIDETAARRDLAERRESKFELSGRDVAQFRNILQVNARRQVYHQSVSTVRSIYYDSARLEACHANIDGLGRRRKLRIRWYDSLEPRDHWFVEVKWRDNRVTGKHRLAVHSDRPLAELTYREIGRLLQQIIPDRLLAETLNYTEPIVIVEYRREHFIVPQGDLRLTIDYNLAFYDQTGRTRISTRFAQRMSDFIVLEGKTPVGQESRLRQAFHPLSLRATRCSKYVLGCQMLGLIRTI